MKFYKDENGSVYKFKNDQQMQKFAKTPLVAVGDEEKTELLAPPPETQQEAVARYERELDDYVETVAKAGGYNSIDSIAKFLAPGTYREPEARAYALWVDKFWREAEAIMASATSGTSAPPTVAEVIEMLPAPPVKGTDYSL